VAALTVWRFEGVDAAHDSATELEQMRQDHTVRIWDAALVVWPHGAVGPRTAQLQRLVGAGALGPAFWGFVHGLIFGAPMLGLGSASAAGSLADVGVDDHFVRDVRSQVVPGTSALVLLTSEGTADALADEWQGRAHVIHTRVAAAAA
jgi:uncharacterized membrane protein